MKCPKCKKGKLKYRDDKWFIFGFKHIFFLSRYKCPCCDFHMIMYRRVRYPVDGQHSNVKGVLNPKYMDDDWLELCQEHKLKMENPTEAFVLDRLSRDYTEIVGIDMGQSFDKVSIVQGRQIGKNIYWYRKV